MKTYYRTLRMLLTIVSTLYNRIALWFNGAKVGRNFRTCGFLFIRNYGGNIEIGDNVNINSALLANPIGGQKYTSLVVGSTGVLKIGNNVGISNASVFATDEVVLDDGACIGAGTKIYDTDFHSTNPDYRMNGNSHVPHKPVYIGKKAFIGGHCVILKGVKIGMNAVVGAGTIVSKSIPANEIWAGNPARFVKKLER